MPRRACGTRYYNQTMQSQGEPQLPRLISRISIRGCPEEIQTQLLAGLPIHEGDMLSDELLHEALQAAKTVNGGFEIHVGQVVPRGSDDAVDVTIYNLATVWPRRIKVQSSVMDSRLIEKVVEKAAPVDSRQPGVARLTIVVGRDGNVIDAKPLSAPEALAEPAIEAARHRKYRPTLLNGIPVEVETTVDVSFAV
jgi:hypothetical protein